MTESYQIPSGKYRTEIIVVNSRFITTIDYTPTIDKARNFIASIRSELPDASHHVYAFRVGYGNSVIEGMSDDGEPTGTSGPPTLAVVRGSDIGDISLVTTRYFGGTKLGTGGLVRAYTESAQTALKTLATEIKAPKRTIGIDVPYSMYEIVKRLILEHQGNILDEIFAGEITFIIEFVESYIEAFSNELREASSGQITIIMLS